MEGSSRRPSREVSWDRQPEAKHVAEEAPPSATTTTPADGPAPGQQPKEATRDLTLRTSAWKTSEVCGMLAQGTKVLVLKEVELEKAMGKRVVRAQVTALDDYPPLGWVTSFKNGVPNLVEPGSKYPAQPIGLNLAARPRHTTAGNRRPSGESHFSHRSESLESSMASRMAKHRLTRQRYSSPGTTSVTGPSIVAAIGSKYDQHAVE